MKRKNKKECLNCKYWGSPEIKLDNDSTDFTVLVSTCSLRNDAYTDEFYRCEQFEPKEESHD